jgi:hypothetical protein
VANGARNNIFVIGDLVIDHTVVVKAVERPHDVRGTVYEVIRRIDTAGGAANCARILAALSPGFTFLWGLIGHSVWGGFRGVLENSQIIDGSNLAIKFRGVQDETHARINTISRVERISEDDDHKETLLRFDDHGHVHVPDDKRKSAFHYLVRVNEKYNIHGVVINDLDMNCLKITQIEDIAAFCLKAEIPLFVNPNFTLKNYNNIKGTAILSSLDEWRALVGSADPRETWLAQLDHPDGLTKMAHLSVERFGKFDYQIVLCGELGSVLILPSNVRGKYEIYRAHPPKTRKGFTHPKLGCSDIMTAVFALELCSHPEPSNKLVLNAFAKANVAVGSFQDMRGPRMPLRGDVHGLQQHLTLPDKKLDWLAGVLYLPKEPTVQLSDHNHATRVPTLYSVDPAFRETMNNLVTDIQHEWTQSRSIILGAPSASGKTTILKQLESDFGKELGVHFRRIEKIDEINWSKLDASLDALKTSCDPDHHLLLGFDEAAKVPFVGRLAKFGVQLLNAAEPRNVRCLFVSAEFNAEYTGSLSSEFRSRCRPFYIPPLTSRFEDIPYVVGGMLFKQMSDPKVKSIKVERSVLLALINQMIKHPNLREIEDVVELAYKSAKKRIPAGPIELTIADLPRNVHEASNDHDNHGLNSYEFVRL